MQINGASSTSMIDYLELSRKRAEAAASTDPVAAGFAAAVSGTALQPPQPAEAAAAQPRVPETPDLAAGVDRTAARPPESAASSAGEGELLRALEPRNGQVGSPAGEGRARESLFAEALRNASDSEGGDMAALSEFMLGKIKGAYGQ